MRPFFVRNGLLFRPVHIVGWLILLFAVGFEVYGFLDIDSRSHSVSDTVRNAVFLGVLIFIGYSLIAFLSLLLSGKNEQ